LISVCSPRWRPGCRPAPAGAASAVRAPPESGPRCAAPPTAAAAPRARCPAAAHEVEISCRSIEEQGPPFAAEDLNDRVTSHGSGSPHGPLARNCMNIRGLSNRLCMILEVAALTMEFDGASHGNGSRHCPLPRSCAHAFGKSQAESLKFKALYFARLKGINRPTALGSPWSWQGAAAHCACTRDDSVMRFSTRFVCWTINPLVDHLQRLRRGAVDAVLQQRRDAAGAPQQHLQSAYPDVNPTPRAIRARWRAHRRACFPGILERIASAAHLLATDDGHHAVRQQAATAPRDALPGLLCTGDSNRLNAFLTQVGCMLLSCFVLCLRSACMGL